MKKVKYLLNTAIFLFLTTITIAQVSADSVQSLHQQKQVLELTTKINDQKIKLAKLENTIDKKTKEMESTATDAQHAADENATAASRLSGDPQDKKLARQAESAGDNAKKSAKRARIAGDNLADLKKEIATLKNKIAEGEAKLASMSVPITPQQ